MKCGAASSLTADSPGLATLSEANRIQLLTQCRANCLSRRMYHEGELQMHPPFFNLYQLRFLLSERGHSYPQSPVPPARLPLLSKPAHPVPQMFVPERHSLRTRVSAFRLLRDPDSSDQFLKSRVVSHKVPPFIDLEVGQEPLTLVIRFVQIFYRLYSGRFIRFSRSLNRGSSRRSSKSGSTFIRDNCSFAAKPFSSAANALSLSPSAP